MLPIPTFIRSSGVEVARSTRDYIRRKLATKLAKFAPVVRRASVRIEDVNGPRGGVDYECRIKVVLDRHPSVVFAKRSASAAEAIDAALAGIAIAVRRTVVRRRARPITRGRHAAAGLRL
ncbi:MAG TPA: HPF/RaiA family ribosome-associated protein [Gammaproteobacteria bacterium]|jgi:ribosome-associated translation inhibitor RaiA|nr:HPF/RaiA family ribosome-associated protein [Gammaproteobacteria bacterium]